MTTDERLQKLEEVEQLLNKFEKEANELEDIKAEMEIMEE